MALEYAQLPDDPEELKQMLLKHSSVVEALRAEVLRLRRWRFGRSSEVIDTNIAPELPLAGGESAPPTPRQALSDLARPPRLMAVESATAKAIQRRTPRLLPPDLPRIIKVHPPSRCTCPDCGKQLSRLGEDASEQLDYVPGYFQVIRHVRPKLSCGACAKIRQAPAPSRPIERGLPTAALLAQVVAAKYADHSPLYRIWTRIHIRYYESAKIWAGSANSRIASAISGELKHDWVRIFTVPAETGADVNHEDGAVAVLLAFGASPNTAASWSGRLRCSREWWLAAHDLTRVQSSQLVRRLSAGSSRSNVAMYAK